MEQAQKDQFMEFSKAWDSYMSDYEQAAYTSLEHLKEKHDQEVAKVADEVK